MNKRIITAVALSIVASTTLFANVTYEKPNEQFKKNLHKYGTGVANWEEKQKIFLINIMKHKVFK